MFNLLGLVTLTLVGAVVAVLLVWILSKALDLFNEDFDTWR
jgi:ABC-type thiamin/hydroxymethylpyrimidine transport system permease subunit